MRIGHGYDIHRFGNGDHIYLGGVRIPHTQGMIAHSDGDVLIHALCDALLGAIGLGDIGQHFPDTDPQYRAKDSTFFLRTIVSWVHARGYQIQNADMTVIAEAPKIGPHRVAMCETLAPLLAVEQNAINVKATTAEGLGEIGKGAGIAVFAVVLLQKCNAAI